MLLERIDLEAREVVKVPAALEHAQERVIDVRLDLLKGRLESLERSVSQREPFVWNAAVGLAQTVNPRFT